MLLWELVIMFLGLMIMVTCIYLPNISSCGGWCCSSRQAANRDNVSSNSMLPYQVNESRIPLHKYARQVDNSSVTPAAVMILENFYFGLATMSIPHQPLYNVARIAAEAKLSNVYDEKSPYVYTNKNKFPVITVSGKKGTWQEIYNTVFIAQALAKPNAYIIVNGMISDSPAFEAWSNLVHDEIIHWKTDDIYKHDDEVWAKGRFKDINGKTSVSEYLVSILNRHLELTPETLTKYYVISKDREDELRRAYQKDKSVTVNNVTSVYHAMVLKVLYPTINVQIEDRPAVQIEDADTESEEQELFGRAVEFLKTYILV